MPEVVREMFVNSSMIIGKTGLVEQEQGFGDTDYNIILTREEKKDRWKITVLKREDASDE